MLSQLALVKSDVVAHAYNPSTWEMGADGSVMQGRDQLHSKWQSLWTI